ncbi:MAG: AAA family ATPase [Thermomicrobiales bacterium]
MHPDCAQPSLLILCGLPFAGKSTLAVALAHRLTMRLVSMDAINTERCLGLNAAPISSHQWAETYREMYRRLDEMLAAGISVVYDAPNATRQERDDARAIAIRNNAATRTIYVPILPDEAWTRLLANRVNPTRHDVRDADFDDVLRRFESPNDEPDTIAYDPTIPVAAWIRRMFPTVSSS